jgi:tetratricopeptide (TPR) repeat protein
MDQVAQAMKIPASERLAYLEKHAQALNSRDDLVVRWVDLCLEIGGESKLKAALDRLKTRRFNLWEGGYDIHDAWVEVNQELGGLAMSRKDYPAALQYYKDACEYPKNLGVASRTPDFRAHVNWNLARVYIAMGKSDLAETCLKQILAEKYGKPNLGTYYQALAQRALKNGAASKSLLDSLEKRAREMTSGGFEYRGDPQTIGYMLLALVLDEKGDKTGAAVEREKALEQNLRAMRLATRQAQIEYAGAHQ